MKRNFFAKAVLFSFMLFALIGCDGAPTSQSSEVESEIIEVVDFSDIQISATQGTPYGISTQSAFRILSEQNYGIEQLTELVSITPETNFTLTKHSEGNYELVPSAPLEDGGTYTVTLTAENTQVVPYERSFSVYDDFKLINSNVRNDEYMETSAVLLSFNSPPRDLEQHVSFEPALIGRWEYSGTNAIYLIQWDRQYDKISEDITINISPELSDIYGRALEEEYELTSSLLSNSLALTTHYYEEKHQTFLPDEVPYIQVSQTEYGKSYDPNSDLDNIDIDISIYKVNNVDDYIFYMQYIHNKDNLISIPEDLELVLSVEDTLNISEFQNSPYDYVPIILPQALPIGHYIMQVDAAKENSTVTLQKLLQVSPYSFYSENVGTDTLIWLNDTETASALSEAKITVYSDNGEKTAVTDENGIATLKLNRYTEREDKEVEDYYFSATKDGLTVCDYIYAPGEENVNPSNVYNNYLFTDRQIYKPNDTIHYWGVLRPSATAIESRDKVRVALLGADRESILYSEWFTLDEKGIVQGEIPLDNYASNSYILGYTFEEDDKLDNDSYWDTFDTGSYISIKEYQKPDYKMSIETNKEFYTIGDTLEINGNISFFDGMPIEDKVLIFSSGYLDIATVTTDAQGNFNVNMPYVDFLNRIYDLDDERAWEPIWEYIRVRDQNVWGTALDEEMRLRGFPSELMLSYDSEVVDDKTILTLNLNEIDAQNLDSIDDYYEDEYSAIKGAPASVPLTVEIERIYRTKTQTGTYFDPYTQTNIPMYSYSNDNEIYATIEVVPDENGIAVIEDIPKTDELNRYTATVYWTDAQGRRMRDFIYNLGNYRDYNNSTEDNVKNYSFTARNTKEAEFLQFNTNYSSGDSIELKLLLNDTEVEESDFTGKMLITEYNTIAIDSQISESHTHEVDITDTHATSFYMGGAYFDGKYVYPIMGYRTFKDYDDMLLNLELDTDKETYTPGDEVTLDIIATDNEGNVVSGADIAMAFVDEAVHAISEQYISFADEFHRMPYFEEAYRRSSYRQPNGHPYTGGGMGGGGGDSASGGIEPREDFVDSLGIMTTQTGDDGSAQIKLTMPDNLTEWRLTALAIDSESDIGQGISSVKNTLPYYVRPIISSVYLTGDEIALTLMSFGSENSADSEIEYTVSIEGTDVNVTQTASGDEFKNISLPPLEEGEYKITVTGTNGKHSDGVTHSFKVMETTLETSLTSWVNLSEGEVMPEVSKSPVRVDIYNEDYDAYFRAIYTVLFDNSSRQDADMAKVIVNSVLDEVEKDEILHKVPVDRYLDDYYSTGMLMFSGESSADVFFTAQASILLGENLFGARNYDSMTYSDAENALYYDNGDYSYDEIAALLLACANTLNNSEDYYENQKGEEMTSAVLSSGMLSVKGKIHAIGALSYYDKESAQEMFENDIMPLMDSSDTEIYLPQSDGYRSAELTADALMLAMILDADIDKEKMVEHIASEQENLYTRARSAIPLAMYVKDFVPAGGGEHSVSYNLNGENITVKLEEHEPHTLTLTKVEYDALDLKSISGTPLAVVNYVGSYEENGFVNSDNITLERSVTPMEGQSGTYSIDFTVTFSPEAESGMYKLISYIPSNMRILPRSSKEQSYFSTDLTDTQVISYRYYDKDRHSNTQILSYHVQEVFESGIARFDDTLFYNVNTMDGVILPLDSIN